MKKYYLIALTVFMTLSIGFSQSSSVCRQAMASYPFRQQKIVLKNQISDSQRLNQFKKTASRSCFSSLQVKELAQLFSDEYLRLEFAQIAYRRVVDQDNFYDVYDAFSHFSTAFKLHDYVLTKGQGEVEIEHPIDPVDIGKELRFPSIEYPSYKNYNGKKNCSYPMAESDFMEIARVVHQTPSENIRLQRLDRVLQQSCLTTAQAMKLATLLSLENNKLSFLKDAYAHVFDAGNYSHTMAVFQYASNRENLLDFLESKGYTDEAGTEDTMCKMSDTELATIKKQISKETFSKDKLRMMKTIFRVKKCFVTTQQAKSVIGLVSSGERLDAAKYMYDYTSDKDDYYLLKDVMVFIGDKRAFMDFLESKH